MRPTHLLIRSALALTLGLAAASCTGGGGEPRPLPPAPEPLAEAPASEPGEVGVTIVGGEAPVPAMPGSPAPAVAPGDIKLNFPGADVRVVARAVLGDLLRVPYTIAPGTAGQVTVVTPAPVARASVLQVLENALAQSGLALVPEAGGYTIMPVNAARAAGLVGETRQGYASEIVRLQFINADELKKLLDSVVPNVVIATDASANTMTIAGTSGQRASARDLIAQFDVNWLRSMSFGYFVPQRTDARLIVPELEKLINAPDAPTRGLVRLIAMERLNGIIAVSAQGQYLEDVRRWIEVLDREGTNDEPKLFVYRVQNGRSKDLAATIRRAFGQGGDGGDSGGGDPFASGGSVIDEPGKGTEMQQNARPPASGAASAGSTPADAAQGRGRGPQVSITNDDINNAVIVFGSPREYAVVDDALRKLDIPPYQVMIEAAITEVSLTDDLRFGVQWNFQSGDANFALTDGTSTTPVRATPGFSFYLSNSDITAALNALEERTNIKVVSAPKLVVLNNQTAALQVGDQVPIQTQSATSVIEPDAPIVNAIEYRDTGVILKVTPRVNAGGLVLLDIAQEVSDISSRTVSGISSPIISTRRVATSIAVHDGQVVTLGGLFRDSKSFGKNGIPILSRIPVLGSLFGKHVNTQNRTELLVLIRPRVLRTADDARAVTEELRAKLRTLEPFKTKGTIP